MQPLHFFRLIFGHLNTYSQSMNLVYLMVGSIMLATVLNLSKQYQTLRCKPVTKKYRGLDTRALHHYRNAIRNFDREVEAWEQAAQQVGRRP